MLRVSETTSINRPPGEVFDFVADLRNFPIWRANLASSTLVSDGYTDVGATCDEEIQMGPRRVAATCRITAFSQGRTFSFQAVSPGLIYDGLVVVEPSDDGSTFTLSGDITLKGATKLLRPFLKGRLQAGVRQEVAAVKTHLEAR